MEQLNPQTPPAEIMNMLQGEKPEFSVYVKRIVPLFHTLLFIFFGLGAVIIPAGVLLVFWLPVLSGQPSTIIINGKPVEIGPGNTDPLIIPTIAIFIFMFIGLILLIYGIIASFPKPAWIIGAKDGLIVYQPRKKNSYSWSQFTGNMSVRGDDTNGKIVAELKTGNWHRSKHGHQRFVPDKVYIFGIQNISQIEQIIRKRISENQPQPQMPKTV